MRANETKGIHSTSTGKVFKIYDSGGNPVSYKENKSLFSARLKELFPGQKMIHKATGITIERIK